MKPTITAGIDEAGRGPLAGPVVAACVILNPKFDIPGLEDSKKLSKKQREIKFQEINFYARAIGIGIVSHKMIDKINILQASFLAFKIALNNILIKPDLVLIDGNSAPSLPYVTQTIIKGDTKISEIKAASIIAKVTRDQIMQIIDKKHPEYNFKQHAGYPTKDHLAKLEEFGPCPYHRLSYAPVRRVATCEI